MAPSEEKFTAAAPEFDQPADRAGAAAAEGVAANLPLLATKLHVPPLRTDTLARPRLLRRLDAGLHAALTLIAAPAGFGKTTLVEQWLAHCGCPVAWLALDRSDNDPVVFLRYVVAALQTVLPASGATLLALLQTPQPPAESVLLTALLNDLAMLEHDTVLVLNDYHVVQSPPIHQALSFLLQHLPPRLHIVIVTREDPPLALSRLRARRQLVELRAADLRFTADETAEFLRQSLNITLAPEEIAALEARTEGWIAGLHLAALAMQHRGQAADFVKAFTGSNRFIIEYLVEEVLEQLPIHLQTFLLQSSILERFCAELCDALILGPEQVGIAPYSQLLLEQLERMNLFLIPLDDERRWYRYHHLFADVLRERLRYGAASSEISAMHLNASAWFEQHGLIDEAIAHALAGAADAAAAEIVERNIAPLIELRHDRETQRWLSLLPHPVVRQRPQLALAAALSALLSGTDLPAVAPWLECAAAVAGAAGAADGWLAQVDDGLLLVRCALALLSGDLATFTAYEPAVRARLTLLQPFWAMWAHWMLAALALLRSDLASAREIYSQAQATVTLPTSALFLVLVNDLGLAYCAKGFLGDALLLYQSALRRAEVERWPTTLPLGLIHLGVVRVAYERNQLDLAANHARQVLSLGQQLASVVLLLLSQTWLALLLQLGGDHAAAAATQLQVETLVAGLPEQQQIWLLERAYALYQLNRGDLQRASAWANFWHQRLPQRDPFLGAASVAVQVLVALRQQQPKIAAALLDAAITAGRVSRTEVPVLILEALIQAQRGELPLAQQTLLSALMLAAPEGALRPFVDAGPPLADLLLRLSQDQAALTLQPFIAQLLGALNLTAPVPSSAKPPMLPEPLNEREQLVLTLIAGGLSNREIAAQLRVALSTVKWHINNLYGKLGVSTRTQALARAKELGLL